MSVCVHIAPSIYFYFKDNFDKDNETKYIAFTKIVICQNYINVKVIVY